MANPEHLAKLKEGVKAWNQWREQNAAIQPDLSEANLYHGVWLDRAFLRGANLRGAFLSGANLRWVDLGRADLGQADLGEADLTGAHLGRAFLASAKLNKANLRGADLGGASLLWANLSGADLSESNLSEAKLVGSDFWNADLRGANLSGANLSLATLVDTNLAGAILTDCRVYGISAWNVKLEGAIQSNLVITDDGESPIQVDNLEVAQFIYLLLNNQKIRSVIETITSKVVLILGRFTPERKVVLEAIRDELRKRDYLPVLFDFKKPDSRDLTETVSTLAHMARFVIADITDAKSIPQELMAIVPNMPSVPVQPLLLASQQEYGMFEHFRNFPWVLEEVLYDDQQTLLAELSGRVIAPAEAKAKELARKK